MSGHELLDITHCWELIKSLQAQVENWERKEITRGSHCSDMEQRAIEAERKLGVLKRAIGPVICDYDLLCEDSNGVLDALKKALKEIGDA